MPGLFGVIQTAVDASALALERLVREMGHRLTLPAGQRIEICNSPSAAIGRYGARFHHAMEWSGDPSMPIVAGRPATGNAPIAASTIDVSRLRGPFAIAFKRDGAWTVAVDRTASIPIYFTSLGGTLLFASEVKALLAHPQLDRDVDQQAFSTFLACGHLIGDQTLFGSIRRLRGGHALTVEPTGTVVLERYWRFLPGRRDGDTGRAELEQELGDRLVAATAQCLNEPEDTVLLLSGGIDSRSLLGAAMESTPARLIHAVTFAGEGGDSSDVDCAVKLARVTGIRHRVIQRKLGDFGTDFPEMNGVIDGLSTVAIYSPDSYRQYRQLAREGVGTVLRGDEALSYGGPVANLAEAIRRVSLRRVEEVEGLGALIREERLGQIIEASAKALDTVLREAKGLRPAQAMDAIGFEHHLQTFLASSAAYKSVLLSHRTPLLDDAILDLMELLPDGERVDKRLFYRAMARRYPKLFDLAFAKRWSTLDDWAAVLNGPTPARSYMLAQLNDVESSFWELIDRSAALDLFGRIGADARATSAPVRQQLRAVMQYFKDVARACPIQWVRRPVLHSYRPRPHVLILRLIALKHWHDCLRTAPAAKPWPDAVAHVQAGSGMS
ncbi:MAG TPA: asparagine synthase-related protein [Alphaproteobacteria bacterium]|nr:asparagine synthase-related protein [Alphaproteobacteria bacterium]